MNKVDVYLICKDFMDNKVKVNGLLLLLRIFLIDFNNQYMYNSSCSFDTIQCFGKKFLRIVIDYAISYPILPALIITNYL